MIYFVSDSFTPSGNILLSHGTLTMHGVSQNITFPLMINTEKQTIQTHYELNRFNYNLTPHKRMIGTTVNITLNINTTQPLTIPNP